MPGLYCGNGRIAMEALSSLRCVWEGEECLSAILKRYG